MLLPTAATTRANPSPWTGIVLGVGVLVRVLSAFRGYNFDVESYRVIADVMNHGGNVYQETTRYNYAPIWFNVLHGLDMLPSYPGSDPTSALRWKIVFLLATTDIGIFFFLLSQYSLRVATLFFLNPVSMLVTGYHNQFDNVAVLVGLVAALELDRARGRAHWGLALSLLGLSMCVKHVLFLFPVWLALKRDRPAKRFLAVFIPYAIFAASFVPYAFAGFDGIVRNVLLYRSEKNAPLWHLLLPDALYAQVPPVVLFVGAMLVLGYLVRAWPTLARLNVYLVAVVVFASAVANQYLAICVAPIAVAWNWIFAAYTAFATLLLVVDVSGLHIEYVARLLHWHGEGAYGGLVVLLGLGLALAWQRRSFLSARLARRLPLRDDAPVVRTVDSSGRGR